MKALSGIAIVAALFAVSPGVDQIATAQTGLPVAPGTAATPLPDGTVDPSPVGGASGAAQVGGAGIPLATTELYAGGLSPAPPDQAGGSGCPATSGVGALGTSSIFSGDGTMSSSSSALASTGSSTGSGCGASTGAISSGTASAAAPGFTGGNIPLGATQLGSSGISGTIGVQAPGTAATGSLP